MYDRDIIFLSPLVLDLANLDPSLADPSCGAVASFVGRVRDEHLGREVLHLDYEAWEALALKEMKALVAEARQRWALGPIVVAHRTGRLDIGDVAVIIAVAGGHRGESFDACRLLIEGVKASVPVWKHEFYADGSEAWVGAPGWKALPGAVQRD